MNENQMAAGLLKSMAHRNWRSWEAQRKSQPLALFQRAARTVPAYKHFLQTTGIDPSKITTFEDFQNVPPISKQNYLTQYPLNELAWGGSLDRPLVFTSTSGSTGNPFYFPRSGTLDWQGSLIHEMFLRNNPDNRKGPVLVLVCFGMGVWIGGLITYRGFEIAANRANLPISILTPGINKAEIYSALKRLAPHFAQTILVGYPPFLKDVVDNAAHHDIDIKNLRLRFSCAAEAFTEGFRDYLTRAAGSADPCLDTMNIYGSADIGAMAYETPLSISIRRFACADSSNRLFESVFGKIAKTPTLAQYNPQFITFEASAGELLITGDNAIPLVRYAIGDHGGAISFGEMTNHLVASGTSMHDMATPSWPNTSLAKLPFVYVYERADFSTTLYGLQVYPEHIRDALLCPSISHLTTGRFCMSTRFDDAQDQYLEINLEARPSAVVDAVDQQKIRQVVVAALERLNSEFRELLRFVGPRAWPRFVIWPADDPKYFRPGSKQVWSAK